VAAAAAAWRTPHERLRRIVKESLPVLAVAGVLSTLAGLVLQKQLHIFESYGAILVLAPAFVSSAGALGGVLASTLATGLHLGTVDPSVRPARAVWRDARGVAALAVPVYLFNGLGAYVVGTLLGESSPGPALMVAASLLGAVGAVSFVVAVAYYSSVAAVRFRVDPDSYGIPIVTSSVDFIGAVSLILALTLLGIR